MTDRNEAGADAVAQGAHGLPPLEDRLPVIPVGGTVVFPGLVVPLALTDPALVRAVQSALRGDRLLVLLSLRPGRMPQEDEPGEDSPFYDVGTLGGVVRVLELPDGSVRALVQALARVDVSETRRDGGLWSVAAQPRLDLPGNRAGAEALRTPVTAELRRMLLQMEGLPEGAREAMLRITDVSELTDLAAANLSLPPEDKQELLEERDLGERTRRVLAGLERENQGESPAPEGGLTREGRVRPPRRPAPDPDAARTSALLERARFEDQVGAATALAYTAAGGQILFVEAVTAPGSGRLRLTGQASPDVREAAYVALSWLRSHGSRLQLPPERFREQDVHIHVPVGDSAGDGPSAGLALVVALASAFTGRPVRRGLALAGEMTLHGRLLPVDGVGERRLAAGDAGLHTLVVPRAGEAERVPGPDEAADQVALEPVDSVGDALELALVERRGNRREGDARAATSGEPGRRHGHWYDPG